MFVNVAISLALECAVQLQRRWTQLVFCATPVFFLVVRRRYWIRFFPRSKDDFFDIDLDIIFKSPLTIKAAV